MFFVSKRAEKSPIACLCVERHGVNCASASKSGKMFIPPETWLPADNYALARNATFSTNLDTKRRVHLERHGSDVTRDSPLVHNLLLRSSYSHYYEVIRNIIYEGLADKRGKGAKLSKCVFFAFLNSFTISIHLAVKKDVKFDIVPL